MKKLLALGATVLMSLYICLVGLDFKAQTMIFCNDEYKLYKIPGKKVKVTPTSDWERDDKDCVMNCLKWRTAETAEGVICLELVYSGDVDI